MLKEKEQALFEKWGLNRLDICPDGVVDEVSFLSSKPKLLFLMKDVNAKGKPFDLKEFLQKGGRPETWNNISRWIYGIRHMDREIGWAELETNKIDILRPDLLKSICVVNLKKSSGGFTTDKTALRNAAVSDKELILQQLELYSPDLIISCGSDVTDSFLRLTGAKPPEWNQTSRGIWYFCLNPKTMYISYLHPEARVKDSLLYYGLIDAIKEIFANAI